MNDSFQSEAGFCGHTKLWDTNLTWNSKFPDFTPCFHKTILVLSPCLVLWVLAPLEGLFLIRRPKRKLLWSWQTICKLVATTALALLGLAELINIILLDTGAKAFIVPADYVGIGVKIITYGLSASLLIMSRRAGEVTSVVQMLFWMAFGLCQGFTFGSVITHDTLGVSWNSVSDVIIIAQFALILFNVVMSCVADKPTNYMDIKAQSINPSPEKYSSYFNQLLFFWFEKTVWKARKKPVTDSDLWDLNDEDSVYHIYPKWSMKWEKHRQPLTSQKPKGAPSILGSLFLSFGPFFFVGAAYQLVYVLLQFVSPQILNALIAFIEGNEPVWHGYFYTVLLSVVALVAAVADSQYWYRMNLVGLRVRTVLSSAIYRKSLALSNNARKKYSAGEIVNLISVDCQKLQDASVFLNMMWSSPLQVGLAIFFLYQQISFSVFVGLGFLLILFPLNAVIWAKMKTYQVLQMAKKDERVRLITEILGGIKVLKLYAWENSFVQRISQIREQEIHWLKRLMYLEGTQFFVWNCAPFLVALASFATFVLSDPVNNVLDAQTAFVSLTLFNAMRGPLFLLPFGIVSLIQGSVSIRRISQFLAEEELDTKAIEHNEDTIHPVVLRKSSFSWGGKDDLATLRSISLQVKEAALVAVVGTVGSGKSSLLSAILGEMTKLEGEVNVRGKVAYVPQQPWMQNATLRENILFGKNHRHDLFDKVLEACALKPDLAILPGGIHTEIGEKGINVSGGQKQRISLARAVYNRASLYLLDDPLSAVDSHVGKHIFEHVLGPRGLLKNKTRILVTHAISFLPQMDQIVVMKEGKISEIGTYDELMKSKGAFAEFLLEQMLNNEDSDNEDPNDDAMDESEQEDLKHHLEEALGVDEVKEALEKRLVQKAKDKQRKAKKERTTSIGTLSIGQEDDSDGADSVISMATSLTMNSLRERGRKRRESIIRQPSVSESVAENHTTSPPKPKSNLIEEETTETNRVKFSIYVYYAKSIGAMLAIAGIVLYALFQAFNIGANLWLTAWSQDEEATTNTAKRDMYLAVYGVFGVFQSICILSAVLIITVGTLRASIKLHKQMLEGILGSTMAFFDTTPIGRIVNRFSKDIDEVDLMIPTHIKDILNDIFSVLGTVFIICYASPIIIAFIIPLVLLFLFIQDSYLAVSRQLKRMVSVTRSPINSSLTESFSGAATIRAFGMQQDFIEKNDAKIEYNQTFYYPECVSNSWLFCRLESLANILIILSSLFAVIFRDSINPGLVGLSLTYALTCQLDIYLITRFVADLEKSIVSVERIKEYQNTPQEAADFRPDQDPDASWPCQGRVEFKNYATRYREGMSLVLKGVSFCIQPEEKVGIVGRTGAGKSSLTLSLFRIIEAVEGSIEIDGLNIANLGLTRLRSALTIIPQDPVLFSGTLRLNLDPFQKYSDEQLWNTLGHAHLREFVSGFPQGLEYSIADGGENLSVGQRQLVCLARALLRKTKILILDEATAAVDLETDDLIQATIRSEFKDCTVLTIAHRIKTIMDSNKILLLDDGKVKEFEDPKNLLTDEKSAFYSMAKDAGLVT